MNNDNVLINPHKLGRYLEAHLPGFRGPMQITKFPTGQSNPTFRVDTATCSYVLRRKPPGQLLKSAHAVDREFRVMAALQDSTVPVPRTYLLCTDHSVLGADFYVMSFVDGQNFVDPRVPELGNDIKARATVYDQMSAVLAAIHSVDIEAANLNDFGKPGNYYERQVARWTRQYRASATRNVAGIDELIAWLEVNTPEDDGLVSLVHGDYRIDNLLFSRNGCRVLAVLDWELATLGHPFADLAYQCMQWRMPVNAPLQGLEGVDRASRGIPAEHEYVESYCCRMGIDVPANWPFYIAFSFFRLAAILEGVKRRADEGNASNPTQARRLGSMVPSLVERAIAEIG